MISGFRLRALCSGVSDRLRHWAYGSEVSRSGLWAMVCCRLMVSGLDAASLAVRLYVLNMPQSVYVHVYV